MTRPYFLRRLSGRVVRQVAGINREPVTPRDFHGANVLIAAWSALFGAGFATLVLIAFFGERILNVICGNGG